MRGMITTLSTFICLISISLLLTFSQFNGVQGFTLRGAVKLIRHHTAEHTEQQKRESVQQGGFKPSLSPQQAFIRRITENEDLSGIPHGRNNDKSPASSLILANRKAPCFNADGKDCGSQGLMHWLGPDDDSEQILSNPESIIKYVGNEDVQQIIAPPSLYPFRPPIEGTPMPVSHPLPAASPPIHPLQPANVRPVLEPVPVIAQPPIGRPERPLLGVGTLKPADGLELVETPKLPQVLVQRPPEVLSEPLVEERPTFEPLPEAVEFHESTGTLGYHKEPVESAELAHPLRLKETDELSESEKPFESPEPELSPPEIKEDKKEVALDSETAEKRDVIEQNLPTLSNPTELPVEIKGGAELPLLPSIPPTELETREPLIQANLPVFPTTSQRPIDLPVFPTTSQRPIDLPVFPTTSQRPIDLPVFPTTSQRPIDLPVFPTTSQRPIDLPVFPTTSQRPIDLPVFPTTSQRPIDLPVFPTTSQRPIDLPVFPTTSQRPIDLPVFPTTSQRPIDLPVFPTTSQRPIDLPIQKDFDVEEKPNLNVPVDTEQGSEESSESKESNEDVEPTLPPAVPVLLHKEVLPASPAIDLIDSPREPRPSVLSLPVFEVTERVSTEPSTVIPLQPNLTLSKIPPYNSLSSQLEPNSSLARGDYLQMSSLHSGLNQYLKEHILSHDPNILSNLPSKFVNKPTGLENTTFVPSKPNLIELLILSVLPSKVNHNGSGAELLHLKPATAITAPTEDSLPHHAVSKELHLPSSTLAEHEQRKPSLLEQDEKPLDLTVTPTAIPI